MGKENGFSIPENYFNNFEDVIDKKIVEANLPKENSFNTPNSYFDNLLETCSLHLYLMNMIIKMKPVPLV